MFPLLLLLVDLLDSLKYLLDTGKSPNDFTLEDTRKMLSHSPDQDEQANVEEEHKRLQESLIVVPEDFKPTIFVINDVMTKFLYQYPGTFVLEILITSWRKRLEDFVSKFYR
ncbi:hypothetical protein WH8501_15715 [Crocosphaera watsonii WH 8501]|uniref:Uncharacterized protein n=3 Tax=Crocosphaera watsonii TaxID=263511 RepID=Q4BY19_CROWT|nr:MULTISPECIES: hypothetical protein [Crocosphaera]EAM48804.1 hypothetical protein CwatDRAFT_1614 [Crocosphaera watsonii WH 8501]MCH2244267.1 hypothetical protein [Crocosphaera sp.]